MAAAAGMVWLTAAARKVLTGIVPRLLVVSGLFLTLLAAEVVALRRPSASHPGPDRFRLG